MDEKTREMLEQPKLVKFLKMGMLLHKKRLQASSAKAASVKIEFDAANSAGNVDRGMKTPTKVAPVPAPVAGPSNVRLEETRKKPVPRNPGTAARNLTEFQTLVVEVSKPIASPTKMLHQGQPQLANVPGRHAEAPGHVDEPSKVTPVTTSPTKVPAYQRFQMLFKYRDLGELFKCIDTVCAMFHNRKKQITFRKLKPAVQRIARKNFYENRLAQINMFNRLLLAKAKDAHETFLLALDLPMRIAKEKSTRWTPEFDLESCPDIAQMPLSLPPEVERFSSTKDVLSTRRNPFNFRIQPFLPHHLLLLICPINLEAHLPVQELQVLREQTGTNPREPYSGDTSHHRIAVNHVHSTRRPGYSGAIARTSSQSIKRFSGVPVR
ncbi:hypothetical protein pipiens_015561 [Culex pipiens pipiens]|uniref:CDT1 Geminin-binding domain-containing protein n=1 Tax=Culex pipiens pipiens TaxID=38569 RepID=A0ABD1CRR1_CULPP